jgi:non-specific serine/threonine protein kinase
MYKLGLTGTPVLNTYEDLWSQIRFLNKDLVGTNFFAWRKKHFHNANADKPWLKFPDYQPKPESMTYFQDLLALAGKVVHKSQCLDLPPLVKTIRYVDLHEQIARHYRDMEKSFVTLIQDEAVMADLKVTQIMRLNQICSGILHTEEQDHSLDTCKDEVLIELLGDLAPQNKFIIWANFKPAIARIEKIVSALHLESAKIVGGQTVQERQAEIDRFQENVKCSVMIANQGAGGVGVNLQAANYMIYFSKDYDLEKDLQSEARNYRAGSEIHDKVTRIDIVTRGTIEEVITEALANKLTMAELITKVKERYAK